MEFKSSCDKKCNHMCGCMALVCTDFNNPINEDYCTCDYYRVLKTNPKSVLLYPQKQMEFEFNGL
jgi:hypothetical protein